MLGRDKNMNPGRFYMPGMGVGNNFMASPMLRAASSAPRGLGLFSRITNGIRSVNWGGLLNNANKTLNVVNQAIPLVRQAGPMVNNMKSMLKIAKAFGSETTSPRGRSNHLGNQANGMVNNSRVASPAINKSEENYNKENVIEKKEVYEDNYPNFFV